MTSTPSEILSKSKKTPILLTKVEILNGEQFSDHFFDKLLSPLLQQSDLTLEQFLTQCNRSFANLSNTGVFDAIKLNILEDSTRNEAFKDSLPVKTVIDLQVKELQKFQVNSTFYDNGNAFSLKYENLNWLGNGEHLQAVLQTDLRNSLKAVDLNFKSPLSSTTNLFLNGLVLNNSNSAWSSHDQILFNSTVGLENKKYYKSGLTTSVVGGLALNRRTITNVSDSASDLIKSNSGDSLKRSLLLSGSLDSRTYLDTKSLFPVGGALIRVDNEISNDDDNGNFLKSTVGSLLYKSFLGNALGFRFESNLGGIVSLSSRQKIHIQDKFFLGGLDSLPGFQLNSTSLKDGNDYFGGNIFYSLKLSALYRLPFIDATHPIRIVNSVSLGDVVPSLQTLKDKNWASVKDLVLRQNSTNVAVGLLYSFGSDANLNLNYNFPLSSRASDLRKPGLDFSLSIASDF